MAAAPGTAAAQHAAQGEPLSDSEEPKETARPFLLRGAHRSCMAAGPKEYACRPEANTFRVPRGWYTSSTPATDKGSGAHVDAKAAGATRIAISQYQPIMKKITGPNKRIRDIGSTGYSQVANGKMCSNASDLVRTGQKLKICKSDSNRKPPVSICHLYGNPCGARFVTTHPFFERAWHCVAPPRSGAVARPWRALRDRHSCLRSTRFGGIPQGCEQHGTVCEERAITKQAVVAGCLGQSATPSVSLFCLWLPRGARTAGHLEDYLCGSSGSAGVHHEAGGGALEHRL